MKKKGKNTFKKEYLFFPFFNLFFSCVIFFNWRIIALQNFVVFCQMLTWTSHWYTYGPSLLTFKNISKCFPIKLLWLQKSLPNILISITSSWIYSPYHWEWTSKNAGNLLLQERFQCSLSPFTMKTQLFYSKCLQRKIKYCSIV